MEFLYLQLQLGSKNKNTINFLHSGTDFQQ